MGVIKQGILGGFSGKVAGVVGSSWKGIAVIKSRPLSVANPRTAAQTAQRTKFAGVVAFASAILATIVKPLWDRFAQNESGYNAFIRANLPNFDSNGDPTYADLIISSGKMASTPISSVSGSSGDATVTVNWTNDAGQGLKLATDDAYVVVINQANGEQAVSSAQVKRSAGTVDLELPSNLGIGDTVSAYLAFRRADGTIVSDTSYNTYN